MNTQISSPIVSAQFTGKLNFSKNYSQVLSANQQKKVEEIANKIKHSEFDINISPKGRNSKRLKAEVVLLPMQESKFCKQRLFESTIGFIERCVKKGKKLEKQFNDFFLDDPYM